MQPERWLESVLRRDIAPHRRPPRPRSRLHPGPRLRRLRPRHARPPHRHRHDGRLAVIELKADEDLHLALQGLDYWIRVRWHHLAEPPTTGPTSASANSSATATSPASASPPTHPALYLVAPALRIHPATEIILRYLSPRVDWTLVALDERWRKQVKVVWRKRSKSDVNCSRNGSNLR